MTVSARACASLAFVAVLSWPAGAQQPARPEPPSTLRAPSRAELLRGEYGRYRANNDLLHYDLDVRIDPEKKWISGRNTVRFKMLKDDTRIQLELFANLTIDRIVFNTRELKYTRDLNAVYIDFPETLRPAAPIRSISTTRARRSKSGASMRWPSRRIRPAATGLTPRTKVSGPVCGGRARISGVMNRKAWTSRCRCRTV